MANREDKLHLAMFPWLAFSHMIPFLELAKLIAEKGHRISFISTPRNIDRFPKLPPNLSPFINFVKLPLPLIMMASALSLVGPTSVPDYRKKAEEFTVPPKWVPFLTTIAYRLFEVLRVYDDLNEDVNTGVSALQRYRGVLSGCHVIAVRDCVEFEPEWLNLLEDINRKPVLPIGLLTMEPV